MTKQSANSTNPPLNLVRNTQREALTSTLTVDELGKAMAHLDLSTIPHHKHADAIRDHLLRIMAETIHDRTTAVEIHAARHMRAQRQSGLIGVTPANLK